MAVLVALLALSCDPSGGEWGSYYQPDMTWGPASNTLYQPGGDWVERFCEHVHVTCQDEPQGYEECLYSWGQSQQLCEQETDAFLMCVDGLYTCGRWSDWEWWDLVAWYCNEEYYRYNLCMEPYVQWD